MKMKMTGPFSNHGPTSAISNQESLTTLTSTGSSAGTTTSAGTLYGSLGLDIALGSAANGLVDGLDGDGGLLLAVAVVTWIGSGWLASQLILV